MWQKNAIWGTKEYKHSAQVVDMAEFDVHRHQQTLESSLRRLKETTELNPSDQQLILEFHNDSLALGLSKTRSIKYLSILPHLSKMLKIGFKEAKKEHLKELIADLERTNYSNWTKKDYKIVLRRFYKWLKGNDEEYPDEVKWIKASFRNEKHKLPEDLLTEDEVKRLVQATEHPRDRAFVEALYETGCRIAELLTIRLKNVHFDDYGAVLRVSGKTGDRRVRIVASAPSLATWMDMHPWKNDPECPLWLSRASRRILLPFNYSTANILLRRLAKKAGLNKRVNPHLFRHSRATALANKLTEAQMKEYFGWVQSSEMASVYVHLSGRDVDSAILKLHGLKDEKEKEVETFKVKNCQRCNKPCSPASKFCQSCGAVLDVSVALSVDSEAEGQLLMVKTLMRDDEFKEFMARKMIQHNLNMITPRPKS